MKTKRDKLDLKGSQIRFYSETFQCGLADGDALPRFEIVAYTGAVMDVAGYGKAIVDLDGISFASPKIPVVYGHRMERGIGHVEKSEIRDGKLVLEGVVSRQTESAKDFASSAKNGFPWQASIGGTPLEVEFLNDDATAVVNGRTVDSSVAIVRKIKLYETSVVEYGAGGATSSTIKCSIINPQGGNDNMSTNPDPQTPVPQPQTPAEPSVGEPLSPPTGAVDFGATRSRCAAEYRRIAAIQKRGADMNPNVVAQAIEEGWSEEKFDVECLRSEVERLRASRPTAPPLHSPQPASVSNDALVAIGLRACGLPIDEKRFKERDLEAADRFRDASLTEFCELACGRGLPRFKRDNRGWLEAAFSTSNLTYVLSRTATAALLAGFDYVESDWRKVFKVGSVSDFKPHERYRMNSSFKFKKLTDGGRFEHGEISDEKYDVQANTEGIMFALTRKMLINDDLGALTQMPKEIGMGAADAINEACWGLFLNPPKTTDGETPREFFSAANKNLLTGAATALTLETLSKARTAFGKQLKKNGTPLGLRPTILLVPPELEDQALMLTKATQFNNGADGMTPANYNPQAGRFQVVASSYLSAASMSGASSTAWYLLVDPNRLAAFEAAFLNGRDKPTVERADADFDTLGIQFRGYIDFGVSAQDYRGALKVAGA